MNTGQRSSFPQEDSVHSESTPNMGKLGSPWENQEEGRGGEGGGGRRKSISSVGLGTGINTKTRFVDGRSGTVYHNRR